MTLDAIMWRWSAEERALRPLTNRPLELEDGHTYRLTPEEDRNWARHRAYFARLRDLWQTLPDSASSELWAQSPEHLRKWALISTGHNTCTVHDCASKAEAQRTARIIRAEADEFTVVVARGNTVVVYRAKSQDARMKKADFDQSADNVLRFIEDLLGAEAA